MCELEDEARLVYGYFETAPNDWSYQLFEQQLNRELSRLSKIVKQRAPVREKVVEYRLENIGTISTSRYINFMIITDTKYVVGEDASLYFYPQLIKGLRNEEAKVLPGDMSINGWKNLLITLQSTEAES